MSSLATDNYSGKRNEEGILKEVKMNKYMKESLYLSAFKNMSGTLHILANRVVPPIKIPFKESFVFRYAERSIHQAIVQKLARVISTLKSAYILMLQGFVQEQAALQRVLGELHEDIFFLAYAEIDNEITQLHQDFLNAFYEEEFDADTALNSTQKRPMIPRKKIQAYLAKKEESGLDPSTVVKLNRTITKTYSGFIHAASPQIMDMYGGNPPHFHVNGLLGTERHEEYRDDLWNYFYRSIIAFGIAAKAFGDQTQFDTISQFLLEFELRNYKQ
jgi:hypothetical protein